MFRRTAAALLCVACVCAIPALCDEHGSGSGPHIVGTLRAAGTRTEPAVQIQFDKVVLEAPSVVIKFGNGRDVEIHTVDGHLQERRGTQERKLGRELGLLGGRPSSLRVLATPSDVNSTKALRMQFENSN
jgi:hypothetical protein